ncbi:hypothetical protein BAUCODRAFT_111049 [Baudoinia panamericana UAMH 10762]|uniref:Cytochrome P450 monooxygenase n=1 Tax=Baudoinia panamericana (strain UAMH 10762) TaxID=717646 RepID=M2LMH8_BAUPA|nr:uncharacterized protein BAUCODRAFT_111049 [Baudoinia panamericana UAMH 10762]EMC95507.1 hypothetical protein BAUCODRAFT_111049 [Baudoinia panamericana UAMH 10762]
MAASYVLETMAHYPVLLAVVLSSGCFLTYAIYQRFYHPLAKYPGPLLASLTDLWQVYQFLTLKQPYTLTQLHEQYGPVVRYGPDKLSLTDEDAIPVLYQKGGKMYPKTEFYDAYGAAHPNVFGMRNEAQHATRRRHMSHSFSISYVKELEGFLDSNIAILKRKIAEHAASGKAFNLKELLHYYVIDVLGELAFSQSFGLQEADEDAAAAMVPPVVEHSLLSAATGAWPSMTKTLKRWLPYLPYKPTKALFRGRQACANLAAECVARRMRALEHLRKENLGATDQRKDILTNLILARDPETGAHLTEADLQTEAFGFIIAGTHTTSATTTLLFYHLLHAPDIMAQCVSELDANLPDLTADQPAYSGSIAESSLPFLKQCVRENFRITPVFTMPLARRVVDPAGATIGAEHYPQGTSLAVCNHAFHHNPDVWGFDHNTFRPSRWNEPSVNARARYLMHFGLGPRQCIGKTVATTNIYKLSSTLLREFTFVLAEDTEAEKVRQGGFVGRLPDLVSVGVSDLGTPLMVKASLRSKQAHNQSTAPS